MLTLGCLSISLLQEMPVLELGLVQISALLVNTVPDFVFFFLEPSADSYAPFLVETMGCYSISSTGNERKTCMLLEHFPDCNILLVRTLLIIMGTTNAS
jgi:hypothetical protein